MTLCSHMTVQQAANRVNAPLLRLQYGLASQFEITTRISNTREAHSNGIQACSSFNGTPSSSRSLPAAGSSVGMKSPDNSFALSLSTGGVAFESAFAENGPFHTQASQNQARQYQQAEHTQRYAHCHASGGSRTENVMRIVSRFGACAQWSARCNSKGWCENCTCQDGSIHKDSHRRNCTRG